MNPYAGELSASTRSLIPEEEEIKKTLFNNAMKGNWEEVVKMYQKHGATVHNAKITRTGDTAVHIAIADGKVSAVVELVSTAAEKTPGALEIKNELGNTPLHLAASLGYVIVCERIARQKPELAGIRNADNETPFFLAAHHGQKDAFLCLYHHCREKGYTYGRRNDGETILHSAISGEYFDLSFQIIHLYPKLVNSVNEQGFSPLHLLASKPSAFRSGSHIRGFQKLIYHCIFVDELVEKSSYDTRLLEIESETKKKYPGNYQTCVDLLSWIKKLMDFVVKPKCEPLDSTMDPESDHKQEQESNKSQTQGHQLFPDNYLTCFDGVKLLSKAMLVILGLGSMHIVKLREKKQKHIWLLQIMEALLKDASTYEYEDNGRGPNLLPTQKGETKPYAVMDGGDVNFSESMLMEQPVHDEDHGPPALPPPSSSTNNSNNNPSTQGQRIWDLGSIFEQLKRAVTTAPVMILPDFKKPFTLEIDASNGGIGAVLMQQGKSVTYISKALGEKNGVTEMEKKETPLLIAAKNGVTEMVERILKQFPVAVHDMNSEKKNVVLLAVENRQPHVYSFLLEQKLMKDIIFRKKDHDGNSALHLAARLGEHRPWLIPGAALQMQWEIKWYEFVKESMPHHFFARYNRKGQTSRDIFTATHSNLVKEGGQWLTNTSESCSVVAALIATVAFATSATVPGGVKSESGIPTLEDQPTFCIFAVASLVALCFSVTAVVMFLAILTSRYQEKDFGTDLPRKLLVGLTSLFVSIASMLVSFCAGHFFVLKDKLQYAAFPVYAVTCLPVTFFAIAQFPLYFDLAWATFKKVPQRSFK